MRNTRELPYSPELVTNMTRPIHADGKKRWFVRCPRCKASYKTGQKFSISQIYEAGWPVQGGKIVVCCENCE